MTWPFWRRAPEALLGLMLVAGACEPDNAVKPGAPQLVSLAVYDNTDGASTTALELTSEAGAAAVSGYAHVTALFDRLLDPSGLIVFADGGPDVGADLATVTATPGPTPPWTSIYSANGGDVGLYFPRGPSLVVTPSPTFPSGATIVVTLDKSKLHSRKGEMVTGAGDLAAATLTFRTLPFDAAVASPADAMSPVLVTFSNVPADTASASITMLSNGAAFTDFDIGPDPSKDPRMLDLTPKTAWPAGAAMQVDIAATAADALGAHLAGAVTFPFQIPSS